jgi:hypothetical protein
MGAIKGLGAIYLVVGALAIGVVGCAGSDDGSTEPALTSPEVTSTREAPPSTVEDVAEEPATDEPTAAQIREAEQVVKAELPSIPLWEGTTVHGVPTADGDVCVERIRPKGAGGAADLGRNAGFVVVSIPSMQTGEPTDGTCGKPAPEPDERLSTSELNALANELALVIEAGSSSEIVATASRAKNKIDKPLPVLTVQANLIHSATVAAIEAANLGDESQLRAALRYLGEAQE